VIPLVVALQEMPQNLVDRNTVLSIFLNFPDFVASSHGVEQGGVLSLPGHGRTLLAVRRQGQGRKAGTEGHEVVPVQRG
jgi:hypothetical protein